MASSSPSVPSVAAAYQNPIWLPSTRRRFVSTSVNRNICCVSEWRQRRHTAQSRLQSPTRITPTHKTNSEAIITDKPSTRILSLTGPPIRSRSPNPLSLLHHEMHQNRLLPLLPPLKTLSHLIRSLLSTPQNPNLLLIFPDADPPVLYQKCTLGAPKAIWAPAIHPSQKRPFKTWSTMVRIICPLIVYF